VVGLEHVFHESVVFAEVEASLFGGYDSGGVLAPVLEDCKSVEEELVYKIIFIGHQ